MALGPKLTSWMANNLAKASAGASPKGKFDLWLGKKLIGGGASAAKNVSEGAVGLGKSLASPGGSVAKGVLNAGSKVMDVAKNHPALAATGAAAIPSYYYLRNTNAQEHVAPLLNQYIQEGREGEKMGSQHKTRRWGNLLEASEKTGGIMNMNLGPAMAATGKFLAHDVGGKSVGHMLAGGAAAGVGGAVGKEVGGALGKGVLGLLKDMAAKAQQMVSGDPAQKAMLDALMQTDPVLQKADPALIMSAFHTMQQFAPTLAQDENAVRSFLRQAVMSGNGPDFATIAGIAKAEESVRKAKAPMGGH